MRPLWITYYDVCCQKQYFASCTSPKMDLVYPLKFCRRIVFNFSWDSCCTQEKWKTKVMQHLGWGGGGQTRCVIGDAQMETKLWCVLLIITVVRAFRVFVLNKVSFESEFGLCYFVTDWVIRLISVLTSRSYGKFTLMTSLYRMLVEIAMIILMPAKGAL